MKKSFERVLSLALIVVILFSCNNDVKKVEIDNQIAVSLFSGTVKVGDLLNSKESFVSDMIKVNEDGSLYANYSYAIEDIVSASSILTGIQDITFETSGGFEIPEIPGLPEIPEDPEIPGLPEIPEDPEIPGLPELPELPDTLLPDIPELLDTLLPDIPDIPELLDTIIDTVFVFDNFVSIPFEYDGFEINYVELKNGRLYLKLETNLEMVKEIVLTTDNIKYADGKDFMLNLDFRESHEQEIDIDLTNCSIEPKDKNISFSASMLFEVNLLQGMLGGMYTVDLSGGIMDVEFKSIDGAIKDTQFDFEAKHDLNFVLPSMYGDLKIPTPELTIKYVNTFGFNAKCIIDSLFLTDDKNNLVPLNKDWNKMELVLTSTSEEYDSIAGLDELLVDEINLLQNFSHMTLAGDIILGCEQVAENMITDESHIDVAAEITLPLEFKIDNLNYLDTIDFNLTLDGSEEEVNEETGTIHLENIFDDLEFKLVFENAIPIQIKPQVYVMNKGAVIDSLFDGRPCVSGNFDGNVKEDVFVVHVTGDKLYNVQCADQLMLDVNLSSHGKQVVINANDSFDIKIGLKTKTSEIDLDELNF